MSRATLLTVAGVASILLAALLIVTFVGGGGGSALRSETRPARGLAMSDAVEIRIHSGDQLFGSIRAAAVTATLVNRSTRPISLGVRSGGWTAQALFRWRVQLPSGRSYFRDVNLTQFGSRELHFRGLIISQELGDPPGVQPQTLRSGESMKLKFRFPGSTHMPVEPGEHRVALELRFHLKDVTLHGGPTEDGVDRKPFTYLPTTPPFPEGSVTSNGILLTRVP